MGRRVFMPSTGVFDPVSMDFVSGCPILKSALWSGKKFPADFVNLGGAGALFYWGFEVDKADKYGWKVDKDDVFDVAFQPKC